MWKVFVLIFISLIKLNEGLRCYNCFIMSNLNRHEELIPCTDNLTQSNIWDCPGDYPYCAWILYEDAFNPSSQTVIRTCSQGEEVSCKQEIPGLIERDCKMCQGDLCNGEYVPPK